MTNFRKLTTAAAALTLGTVMSTAAFADMSCADYNAMSADDQTAARADMGREGLRDKASGEDMTEEGVGTEQTISDTAAITGSGKDARDAEARGANDADAHGGDEDYATAIVEHCKGGDDLRIKDVRHPTAG